MRDLIELVDYKYKPILDEQDYHKYKAMAQFCYDNEYSINTMNYKELNEYYIKHKKPYLLDGSEPNEENWKTFLKDPDISQIFLDSVVSEKAATLRKLISNIDGDSTLQQGNLKAIIGLKEMVTNATTREKGVQYIQLLAPTAYGNIEVDSQKIIEDLTKKES